MRVKPSRGQAKVKDYIKPQIPVLALSALTLTDGSSGPPHWKNSGWTDAGGEAAAEAISLSQKTAMYLRDS